MKKKSTVGKRFKRMRLVPFRRKSVYSYSVLIYIDMFIVARKHVTRVCARVWVNTSHLHSSRNDLDTNLNNRF